MPQSPGQPCATYDANDVIETGPFGNGQPGHMRAGVGKSKSLFIGNACARTEPAPEVAKGGGRMTKVKVVS